MHDRILDFLFRSNGVTVEMDASGSVSAVQTTLEKLSSQRDELGDLWATRKLRLDLCLQLRLFERDALEVQNVFNIFKILIPSNLFRILVFKKLLWK